MSTVGGTGEAPVCVAVWWDGRREIMNPRLTALTATRIPRATTAAMITVSMKIAMCHSHCVPPLLDSRHITLRCHGIVRMALRVGAAAIFPVATVRQERNAALVSGGYDNDFTNSANAAPSLLSGNH
jgi:hypothetical protein